MRVSFTDDRTPPEGAVAVFATKGKELTKSAADLDKKTKGAISRAIENSRFKGDRGQILEILGPAGVKSGRILVVGLGDPKSLEIKNAQNAGGVIVGRLKMSKVDDVTVMVDPIEGCAVDEDSFAAHTGYGALLRSYAFNKYFTKKTDTKRVTLKRFVVACADPKASKKLHMPFDKVAQGVFLTRNLVSEPANVLYPESLAAECRNLEKVGATVEVLGEKEMTELGMGALLGVGQGSRRESQLVVISWDGLDEDAKDKPIAFVGKGVTFDTGGISIKPAGGMEMMKWDMGGSAAVIGLMKALAGRKAKVRAIGVVGLVENMPDGNAQRPGDVVKSMSGQTIEVINTDAEGRLVLADALHYTIDRFKPQFVIDLATLTGAIITSLGNQHAGIFSNNDELCERLSAAGESEGERVWRLPLGDDYDKMINSQIADMKNIGTGGKAGSITAAQFLQRFVKRNTPWVHIDIAGTAWIDTEAPTRPKGGTGYGVRLLNRLVADHYEAE